MKLKKITDKLPLIFDGAMGTYYRNKVDEPLPECEMANLFQAEEILAIHNEYVMAGAKAIRTNTFGANTISLNCSEDILMKIIQAGYHLAKTAAEGRDVTIFADIGPIPEDFERDNLPLYQFIVDVFLSCGAEHFVFETFGNNTYLEEITRYIKSKNPDHFIIVSFAVNPTGETRNGLTGQDLLKQFGSNPNIDALGFNCVSGPYHLLEYIKTLILPDKLITIMPNAGYPTILKNRTYYTNNANYYGNIMMEFVQYGAEIIGGCCGTTPEYIQKVSQNLEELKPKSEPVPGRDRSLRLKSHHVDNLFLQKVNHGKKVIAVEYDPPNTIDIENYMTQARALKIAGADAITIADCPVGRARVDSSLMAFKIKNEIGLDPIVHLTCRDRNLNATKALLLGLNIENILNLILVTGDPIPNAYKDEIKSVFHYNSVMLAQYVDGLNKNLFTNKMNISAALNINAVNFQAELRKAAEKEKAGVNMFFTQPVLSEMAINNLKIACSALESKIMGGIIPIVSYSNAVFMNEEISGIHVDNDIIQQYKNISKQEATALAESLSIHFMNRIASLVDGFYLITPFNRVDIIVHIIEHFKQSHKYS